MKTGAYRVQLDRRAVVIDAGDAARAPFASTSVTLSRAGIDQHFHGCPVPVDGPSGTAAGNLGLGLVLALPGAILRTKEEIVEMEE